jgi:hypothetical protein
MGAESVDIVIVGTERKSLAELAKRRFSEQLDSNRIRVRTVQQDAKSILRSVDPKHGMTLLLVYQSNHNGLQ